MRQTLDEIVLEIDLRKIASTRDFALSLPPHYLQHEYHPTRVQTLWEDFAKSIRNTYKKYRKTVFLPVMENICDDFNRRTEAIKVQFVANEHLGAAKKTHQLKVILLSEIPDESRNLRFCNAEIPSPEMLACDGQATTNNEQLALIGRVEADIQVEVLPLSDSTNQSSVATDNILNSTCVGPIPQTTNEDSANEAEVINPPVAIAISEVVVAEAPQRSALERMRELETIKHYLTVTEYQQKRQAILDSI